MRGLPQKQNARRADKIRLCGHLRRYKKIVKKTYIIFIKSYSDLLAEARRYNDDLYKMYEDISMKKNNKSDK